MNEIKLPELLKKKATIQNYIDIISFDSKVQHYNGSPIISNIFYDYLFHKYKQKCFLYGNLKNDSSPAIILYAKDFVDFSEEEYKTYLKEIILQMANCIKKENNETLVFPLKLVTETGSHANLLIFRKNNFTIEHFEPHGQVFQPFEENEKEEIKEKKRKKSKMVEKSLNNFFEILKEEIKNIKIIKSTDVCPRLKGLQILESEASKKVKDKKIEGGGYCAAWSMFFAELALKNPTISSRDLLNIIFDKLETFEEKNKKNEYLRNVILGYVNIINLKIEKYFSFIFGKNMSLKEIILKMNSEDEKDANLFFRKAFLFFEIEKELINMNKTKEEIYDELNEKLKENISMQERLQIITKQNMLKIFYPKLEEITESKIEKKMLKPCEKGKKRNKITNRCRKVKSKTKKK